MITNERQYKITRHALQKLTTAASELAVGPRDQVAQLSAEALRSEIDVLRAEVDEYERLRAGDASAFTIASLADLPRGLIRARIARGMSQRDLAESFGLKEQQVQRYEASEYKGASVSRMLEIAALLGLDVASFSPPVEPEQCANVLDGEVDYSKFPIKEMYRRHWFDDFQGSLDAAIRNADELVGSYIRAFASRPALALHRKHIRTGSTVDEYALLAWECRVLDLASRAMLETKYSPDLITQEWIEELVRLSERDDGPAQAIELLATVGIPLVVEPHLPGTHLDGAALLLEDTPVIGLTLRYDRVDNFWFVLLHELFHAVRHLKKGRLTGTFDDLDSAGVDALEVEADELAGDALLPPSAWETAVARYVRTPDTVEALADELKRSPAIVAGRIRHEANNFIILSDLVGSGRVRRQFPDVAFSL